MSVGRIEEKTDIYLIKVSHSIQIESKIVNNIEVFTNKILQNQSNGELSELSTMLKFKDNIDYAVHSQRSREAHETF